MKVAVLLLNQGRGSGEVARQHTKHLIRRGHEVVFLHPRIGDGVSGAVNVDVPLPSSVMPVHEYLPAAGRHQRAVAAMSYQEAASYLPAYTRALGEVADGVDIIIGHHANLTAIATRQVAHEHHKPYVLFLHGTGIEPRHAGLYDDRVWEEIEDGIRDAAGLLVTTEYVRDELVLPVVDVPRDRFLVLPCGVDLDDFHPDNTAGISEFYGLSETFVLCPGALTASKGPQNVVAASRHYAHLAPTIFIGAGDLQEDLELELGSRGRFLGFVSADDRARLVNAASILTAAPEKREHFGIIYAEALAGGTPPVTYTGGGVPSIVTPEVGVLTERTPEALGRAIADLLGEPERRARMARAGRRRAEERFSYPHLVERLDHWLSGFLH